MSALLRHRAFWPLAALGVILLANLLTAPEFFALELRDGRLYGSLVDVLNRAAPVALLAIGMSLAVLVGGSGALSVDRALSGEGR